MRRRLFNIAARGATAVSLFLSVCIVVFLLVLPRLSPGNHSFMMQLRWPLGTGGLSDGDRTFDLCAWGGTIYIGTKVDPPEMGGDPFSVRPGPRPPRPPRLAFGCGDLYWVAGAEYETLMKDAGHQWRGGGFAHVPADEKGWRRSGTFLALAARHAVAFFSCSAAAPILYFVRRRRKRAPGYCPTCGYDCRATPERCPECGTPTSVR